MDTDLGMGETNGSRQLVVGRMELGCGDTRAVIYVLKCHMCGHEHSVEAFEVHERSCPDRQFHDRPP